MTVGLSLSESADLRNPGGSRSARGLAACAAYRRWGISPRPEDKPNIEQRGKPCTTRRRRQLQPWCRTVAAGTGRRRAAAYSLSRWRQAVAVENGGGRVKRHVLIRHAAFAHRRAARLDPVVRGLLWSSSAGFLFVVLNTLMLSLTLQLDPFQTQFLRYVFGLLVMLPLVARGGLAAYRPRNIGGQFVRGAVHTFGLGLWFAAIGHITLADTTAIGFTGPIFIMLGAAWAFGERMRWERWLAA